MSSLLALPEDALEVICQYVDAADIVQLLWIGNKTFGAKVARSAQFVSCQLKGCSLFPFPLFRLPSLRHLRVHIADNYYPHYPLRTFGACALPSDPIETLETLDYRFAQSSAVLSAASVPLALLFPKIAVLKLQGCLERLIAPQLALLPATLRVFVCHPAAEPWPQSDTTASAITCADFRNLPTGLEVFEMSHCLYRTSVMDWSQVHWPNSLRKLVLSSVQDESLLHHLPPQIEHLDLFFEDIPEDVEMPVSELPKTLKWLDVFGINGALIMIPDTPLPPLMQSWNVQTAWEDLTDLTPFLPPTLTFVAPKPDDYQLRPHFYLPLPLRALTFWRHPGDQEIAIEEFPTTVEELTMTIVHPEQIERITKRNKRLIRLHILSKTPFLPLESWKSLATQLVALTVELSRFQDLEHFQLFEAGPLTRLTLAQTDIVPPERFDFGLYLPTGLKTLQITCFPGATVSHMGRTIRQLSPRLNKLRKLTIRTQSRNQKELTYSIETLDYVPLIPKSVTDLGLTVHPMTRLDPQLMQDWPPKLRKLQLSALSLGISLSPQHLAHLPSSLEMLTVTQITGFDDEELWKLLPTNILYLRVLPHGPNYAKNEAVYGNAPRWEDCWFKHL